MKRMRALYKIDILNAEVYYMEIPNTTFMYYLYGSNIFTVTYWDELKIRMEE